MSKLFGQSASLLFSPFSLAVRVRLSLVRSSAHSIMQEASQCESEDVTKNKNPQVQGSKSNDKCKASYQTGIKNERCAFHSVFV